jgi:hypothetical protein
MGGGAPGNLPVDGVLMLLHISIVLFSRGPVPFRRQLPCICIHCAFERRSSDIAQYL